MSAKINEKFWIDKLRWARWGEVAQTCKVSGLKVEGRGLELQDLIIIVSWRPAWAT